MNFVRVLIAGVATLAFGAIANAADLVSAPEAVPANKGFDWNGFYAGVGLEGIRFSNGTAGGTLSAIAGANYSSSSFLIGLEGAVFGHLNNTPYQSLGAQGEVRAGMLVTPDALVYGSLGGIYYSNLAITYVTLGLGTEFVVSDNTTLDIEYKHHTFSNIPFTADSIGASINLHF